MKPLVQVLFATILLTGIILTSCKKNITVAPVIFSTPLQALINSDSSLSVFYAVVQKATDTALYAGTDSVTVLIPTNTAFAAQGVTGATVNSWTAATADSILRYHFIVQLDSLTAGTYVAYKSKLGPAVYGYGNPDSTGNYFNGTLATLQTLRGSNAKVYELSAPLQLPAASTPQLLADSSLAFFAEAVKHTGVNLAVSSGWNTVLAPTNAAFAAAGFPTLQSIDNADITMLTSILQYHILPGQYFTNNFINLTTVTSSQGNSINISFSNGVVQFTGTGNTTAAGITKANRIAPNIIVQEISGVLMQ